MIKDHKNKSAKTYQYCKMIKIPYTNNSWLHWAVCTIRPPGDRDGGANSTWGGEAGEWGEPRGEEPTAPRLHRPGPGHQVHQGGGGHQEGQQPGEEHSAQRHCFCYSSPVFLMFLSLFTDVGLLAAMWVIMLSVLRSFLIPCFPVLSVDVAIPILPCFPVTQVSWHPLMCYLQWCGTMKFWYGSGSAEPYL